MIIKKFINNYKNLKNKVKGKQNSFLTLLRVFDYLYFVRIKHFMPQEYFQFDFYHKSFLKKLNYVSDYEVLHNIPEKYNAKKEYDILQDKNAFNMLFRDCLGRDYVFLGDVTFEEFSLFCERHDSFILKPQSESGGKGVERIITKGLDLTAFYDDHKEKNCLIEEIFQQNEELNKLNADSVNTIRIITMKNKKDEVIPTLANIRIGRVGQCVDNFCAGGMTAAINMDSGSVISPAYDKFCNEYIFHPDSNEKIVGFHIPYWMELKKLITTLAERLPNAHYIGWDVAIGKDKIGIIEGNARPEARLHQICLRKGLRQFYYKNLGKF